MLSSLYHHIFSSRNNNSNNSGNHLSSSSLSPFSSSSLNNHANNDTNSNDVGDGDGDGHNDGSGGFMALTPKIIKGTSKRKTRRRKKWQEKRQEKQNRQLLLLPIKKDKKHDIYEVPSPALVTRHDITASSLLDIGSSNFSTHIISMTSTTTSFMTISDLTLELWHHIFQYLVNEPKTILTIQCMTCRHLTRLLYDNEEIRVAIRLRFGLSSSISSSSTIVVVGKNSASPPMPSLSLSRPHPVALIGSDGDCHSIHEECEENVEVQRINDSKLEELEEEQLVMEKANDIAATAVAITVDSVEAIVSSSLKTQLRRQSQRLQYQQQQQQQTNASLPYGNNLEVKEEDEMSTSSDVSGGVFSDEEQSCSRSETRFSSLNNNRNGSKNYNNYNRIVTHRQKLQDAFNRKDAIHQKLNTFHVLIAGCVSVGKTSICKRFIARSDLHCAQNCATTRNTNHRSTVNQSSTLSLEQDSIQSVSDNENNGDNDRSTAATIHFHESDRVHCTYIAQSYKLAKKRKMYDPFRIYVQDSDYLDFIHQSSPPSIILPAAKHQLQLRSRNVAILDDCQSNSCNSNSTSSSHSQTTTHESNSLSVNQQQQQQPFDSLMLVFSYYDRSSFEKLTPLYKKIRSQRKEKAFPVILVANKTDISGDRCVSKEDVDRLMAKIAQKTSYHLFHECSAQSQRDVDVLFSSALQLMQKSRSTETNSDQQPLCIIS